MKSCCIAIIVSIVIAASDVTLFKVNRPHTCMLLLLLLRKTASNNSFYSPYTKADPDESVSYSLKESNHSQMPFTTIHVATFHILSRMSHCILLILMPTSQISWHVSYLFPCHLFLHLTFSVICIPFYQFFLILQLKCDRTLQFFAL